MALPQQAGNSIHHIGSLASTPVKALTVSRCLRHGARCIFLHVRVFSRHSICGEVTNVTAGVFTTISGLMLELVT